MNRIPNRSTMNRIPNRPKVNHLSTFFFFFCKSNRSTIDLWSTIFFFVNLMDIPLICRLI
jgi:hypothetical protein